MTVLTFDILIVDDSATARATLEHRLRRLGFSRIDTACDGLEALRRVSAKRYGLIFLDNAMPRLSGVDFLRRCKGVPVLDGTAVMMLTGTADGETVRIVKAEGLKIDDFIVKPLDPEILAVKLGRMGVSAVPPVDARDPDSGEFLSVQLRANKDTARLRLFGCFHQSDRAALKTLPDRVAMIPSPSLIIDLRDVVSIDEFGLGMLLLINGVAQMARKLPVMLTDRLTIRDRLSALGFDRVVRLVESEAEALAAT